MTRNLVICVVPTILAFFAFYWLKRKKKIQIVTDQSFNSVHEKLEENVKHLSSLECASSSDLDNTLSDASSFASPISSEKSSESDSPLFDSPLHLGDEHTHCDLILPNCIENSHLSYANEREDFLRFEDINAVVTDFKQPFESECLNYQNSSEARQSSQYKTLESTDVLKQNITFFRSDNLFLSEAKKADQNKINLNTDFKNKFENDDPDNCVQKKIVEGDKLKNLTVSTTVECEKMIETDCHSSTFDDNSLSYVSDDSESKQLAEYINKGSLSSVFGENSLLSSFCDELEKSSASSNSPTAIASKQNNFDIDATNSAKEILNLLSFNDSLINIQEYSDSIAESLKEYNIDKHLETKVEVNNSASPNSCKKNFEKNPYCSEVEKNIDIDCVNQTSFHPKENVDDLVQNNLSAIKDLSLTSNDNLTTDSKLLNIDAVQEVEAEASIVSCSVENGYSKISSLSENNVNSHTYASILNSNEKNSSSDAATCILQQIPSEFTSLTLNSNDSINQLLSSNRTDNATSKSSNLTATNSCKERKQMLNTSNEILSLKRFCEIKTNSDMIASSINSHRNSSSLHQNDNLLESTLEGGYKVVKQCKQEINGFLDQNISCQSSKEFVYEFELPQELCGRLIGKHGRNVKSIMEHSNANVFIKHHPYDPLLKVVVVEGHRADVNEALEIIRRKYPPSMFPAVTLVQTNVLNSTGVPMPESLQLHLPEGASCDVILSSLVSAGHFFLQQPTHPTYPSLSTLDQCMINLYSQMDTPLLPQPIEAGVICAAPVYRGWYRAQVVYICDNSSDCGIKFVDYGGFSQVPISSLRQIRSDFMSLPFQASECYLAQVRPLGGSAWSSEATAVFEELAQGQILQALLVEYADDGIPCVYLYRVQGVSSTFINKELVERGLAEWVGNNNHWDPH